MQSQMSQKFRHDVRGALNVIRLNAELLHLQPSREELPFIIKAIERAVTKIDSLVDLSFTETRIATFGGEGEGIRHVDDARSVLPIG